MEICKVWRRKSSWRASQPGLSLFTAFTLKIPLLSWIVANLSIKQKTDENSFVWRARKSKILIQRLPIQLASHSRSIKGVIIKHKLLTNYQTAAWPTSPIANCLVSTGLTLLSPISYPESDIYRGTITLKSLSKSLSSSRFTFPFQMQHHPQVIYTTDFCVNFS